MAVGDGSVMVGIVSDSRSRSSSLGGSGIRHRRRRFCGLHEWQ